MSRPRTGKKLVLQFGPNRAITERDRAGGSELRKVAGARRRAQGGSAGHRPEPGVTGTGSGRPGPFALTRGPGGFARRCGSSWPAAAAAATIAAEAETHHAAAFMAGPERVSRLRSAWLDPAGPLTGNLQPSSRGRGKPGLESWAARPRK